MKRLFFNTLFAVLFLWLAIGSCREKSEYVSSYFKNLPESELGYAGTFKAFWTFMDCNYPIWDYEASNGLNWDDIYTQYLPKFEEFDYRKNQVSDDELKCLYSEILSRLHDGHMMFGIKNRSNGINWPIYLNPSMTRNESERLDYNVPGPSIDNLSYYDDQFHNTLGSDSSYWGRIIDNIVYFHISGHANDTIKKRREWQQYYSKVKELYENNSLKGAIIDLRNFQGGATYNFHYLLGALQPIKPLSGYHRIGLVRAKSGLGRYDYCPNVAMMYPIDSAYQLNITDVPIVVLSNCMTGSLGERVCYASKQLKNCCVIGMRTWGGLSPLDNDSDRIKYRILGNEKLDNVSLYVSIPSAAFLTEKGEILEGKGVTPDIEVALDLDEYKLTGRDTQLERALEFIRTGK